MLAKSAAEGLIKKDVIFGKKFSIVEENVSITVAGSVLSVLGSNPDSSTIVFYI